MRLRRSLFLFLFSLLIGMSNSHLEAAEYRRFGQDYRALAMGNTGIASATNSAALYYNPAVLASIQDWWVEYMPLELTVSDDAIAIFENAKSNSFSLDTQQEKFDFMEDFIGKRIYLKTNFKIDDNLLSFNLSAFSNLSFNWVANFTKKGFTLAYNKAYDYVLDLEVRNPSLPEIRIFTREDLIQQAGFSMPIGLGQWIIGLTYKQVNRSNLEAIYNMQDAIDGASFPTLADNAVSGSGSGYDIGILYRLASQTRIVIGGVYRDTIKMGSAPDIPAELAIGTAMTHEFALAKWTIAADFRDLTLQAGSEGEVSLNKRIHLGTEFGLFPVSDSQHLITLRMGYNQSYLTSGAEVSFTRAMVLGYTEYIEETGEYAGQKPNARKVLYFSFGF